MARGQDFQEKLFYENAADIAVELLKACQERLDKDAEFQEKARQIEQLKESLRQHRKEQKRVEREYGNPVPFLKGLLHITGKRSEGLALPTYKRWLLYYMGCTYAEAEHRHFYAMPTLPPRATDENVERELRQQRKEGFHPVTLVHYRKQFEGWFQEIGLAESKRRKKSG